MTDALPRRLLAVMFTDIKGFSGLMSVNEARTVRLVEEHRAIVRQVIAGHRGRGHETIEDAFVVLFDAVTDAVECALAMQAARRTRCCSQPRGSDYVRAGIHVDDVIERDGQIYGNGVNIAARIEPLARPGASSSRHEPPAAHGRIRLRTFVGARREVGCRRSIRLAGREVDAHRPELSRRRLLRRPREHIGAPCDLEIEEARFTDRLLELCFQQSAGNSTGPEIEPSFRSVRDGALERRARSRTSARCRLHSSW